MNRKHGLAVGSLILVCDQIFKQALPGLLNTGSFLDIPIPNSLLLVVQVALLFLLGSYLWKQELDNVHQFWLFIIFFAGVSNTLDRLVYGGVVDYIYLYFFVANLADIAINFSMFAIIVGVIKDKWQNYR